jgi:uncharacterized RDD family membrane protein YckC
LQEWAPISSLAHELGLGAAAAPAASEVDPYRAPQSLSADADNFVDGTDVVYAGFWRRWAALFLDQLIISIPLATVFGIVSAVVSLGAAGSNGEPNVGLIIGLESVYYLVYFGVAFYYFAWQESSAAQATIGKRALGIKVTDGNGRRISFKHAAGRWFAASLSYLSMYIGYAMAGFTERKRALHDIVANTLVVDQYAFTDTPERQQRQMSGCLVAFIVGMGVLALFVVGMIVFAVVMLAQFKQHMV